MLYYVDSRSTYSNNLEYDFCTQDSNWQCVVNLHIQA